MTQPDITPLSKESWEALAQLHLWGEEYQCKFMVDIVDKYGQQRDGYKLLTLDFMERHVAAKIRQRFVIGKTEDNKFFSFPCEPQRVESVLAEMSIPRYTKDNGLRALGGLKYAASCATGTPPAFAQETQDFFYKDFYPKIAQAFDQHLPFVSVQDTDRYSAIARFCDNKNLEVKKYAGMDYSGGSGKHITYHTGAGSSAETPDGILEKIHHYYEKNIAASKAKG